MLERHGLRVWAISNHLYGQALCDDPIDQRHRDMLPDRIWGDGDPARRHLGCEVCSLERNRTMKHADRHVVVGADFAGYPLKEAAGALGGALK